MNSYILVLYKDNYLLNYHGNWTYPYNLTDLNNPLFERYTGFSSLYEEYTFDVNKYNCPTVQDENSGNFLDVDTFINEVSINEKYKFQSCVNSLSGAEFEVYKDLKFVFYFPRKRLEKVIRKIEEKSQYNMETIVIFAIILVFAMNAIQTCFIYKEQSTITEPQNNIIEYSRNLKKNKAKLEEEDEIDSDQFWEDVTKQSKFHTIDLVQLFKSLLFRDQAVAKELYETSNENYKEGDKKTPKKNKDTNLDDSKMDMLNNSNKKPQKENKNAALQEQIILEDLYQENEKYEQNPFNDCIEDDDTNLIDWQRVFNEQFSDENDGPQITEMGFDFNASNIT